MTLKKTVEKDEMKFKDWKEDWFKRKKLWIGNLKTLKRKKKCIAKN